MDVKVDVGISIGTGMGVPYLRPVETLSFTCFSWSLATFTADDAADGFPADEDVLPVGPWLELANISESERAPVSQKLLLSPASVVSVGRVVMMMASMP